MAVICLFGVEAQAALYSGGGTQADPYIIDTAAKMNDIGANPGDWDSFFLLTANIDLGGYTGTSFNIIGNTGTAFTGVFDGNGHTISNFTYGPGAGSYVGLFGYIDNPNAEIKNLGLIDPNVAGTGDYVGSLVGWLMDGAITDCNSVGGSVSGDRQVGGLVGRNGGTVSNCYATGSVNGTGDHVGGLMGWNGGTVSNSYATGDVNGVTNVGGLVGLNIGNIYRSYSAGSVAGSTSVGGLAGCNSVGFVGSTKIFDCFSVSDVSGGQGVGGLVGHNQVTVRNSYATGSVSGGDWVGGLMGRSSGHAVSCFWDVNTSGQASSAGGMGKTTAQMKDPNTFIGWGCDPVWTIDEGVDYPRLIWENMLGEIITNPTYGGGAGEPNDPYLIETAEQLNSIGMIMCDWGEHFKLTADIDLGGYTGTSFNIIGINYDYPFTGVFDGNGHTISNFTYDSNGINYIGLFGYVDDPNAEIKYLGLIDPNVNAGTEDFVGSLVGRLQSGAVANCDSVGGNISGRSSVGGLVGYNSVFGTVSNSYATGSVSGNNVNVGGLVGGNSGTVSNSYATGDISGYLYVGGLVGWNYSRVGWNNFSMVSDSYATGSILGGERVGGLVGQNDSGTVTSSYSAGDVNGNSYVGGLVGYDNTGDYTKSFWDSTVNPDVNGIGNTADPNVIGESTVNMQAESTFTSAGWDFVGEVINGPNDFWKICEGTNYPKLAWQIPLLGDFVCPDSVEINDLAVLIEQWLLEKLSADVAPDGGDGFVDFLDWAVLVNGWQSTTDINDLAVFAEQWLQFSAYSADIAPDGGDGIVNLPDFAALADNWLME